MPWDHQVYNQFKSIRYQPFFDLVNLVSDHNLNQAIDVGCGTGEQTSLLAKRFENCSFLGIDSSKEMLSEGEKFVTEKVNFKLSTIEEFADDGSTWDLVFSNAALQWADNHEQLFVKLISKINKGGQFAVQMPFQKGNVLNKILIEMVSEGKYVEQLKGFRRDSPLLELDEYAKLLFESGLLNLNIFLKIYPIIASSEMDLYNFISGSALIPYMEKLDANDQESFTSEFIRRISTKFGSFPAIYPFKRILLYGIKPEG